MKENPELPPNNRPPNPSFADLYSDLFSVSRKANEQTYVPLREQGFDHSQARAKLIAFYLPQFHPIPENDEWWGKGFTEWTNVRKATPNFQGHYQPRVPIDLGYYDLRDIEVQKRQVQLAQKYGVHGFCFYYYWFHGKRLLERPLDQFIANTTLNFPFCICWANENWTRRWDGRDNDILIGQTYSEDNYAAFIRDVAPILLDARYIRVDGKPLLAVYRINTLPDPQQAAEIWRAECRRLGVGEIYLVAVQSFDIADPRPFGFDAAIEFPPHSCLGPATEVDRSNLKITNPEFTGHVYEYRVAAQLMSDQPAPAYTKFKTIMLAWDNTARRQNSSDLFINASPQAYQNWLVKAVDYTCEHLPENQRFIFINAWNEWGEGTYLEPDQAYGYAFLQATLDAVRLSDADDRQKVVASLEAKSADLEQLFVRQAINKEHAIQSLRRRVLERDLLIDSLRAKIDHQEQIIITNSKAFKLAVWLQKARMRILPPGSLLEKPLRLAYLSLVVWRTQGFAEVLRLVKARLFGQMTPRPSFPVLDYQEWIAQNELGEQQLAGQRAAASKLAYRPLISIVTAVYNTPVEVLRSTIQSVLDQTYDNWQLCLVDGNSNEDTKAVLREFQELDPRIKCELLPKNLGISGNTNVALKLATGDYIHLLDHDDLLPPFALFEIARYLNQNPDAEIVYGDEDRIDMNGRRHTPFFKPDWSPDLLLSFMYIGHATYKKELMLSFGGFRSEYDFSQDYDLALRATDEPREVGHIGKVLYHWRELPGSAAAGGKDYARESNIAALRDALKRRGYSAEAVALSTHNQVLDRFTDQPLLSIIIPSDNPNNIQKSIQSILKTTTYLNYEILVVTNSRLIQSLQPKLAGKRIRFVNFDREYNFSAKCNQGVSEANGEYVLFLNDDVFPVSRDWIEKMLGPFRDSNVGAVSPKLVYTNGTIQHAGLVTGVRNLVGTAFHTFAKNSTQYFNLAQCPRTVSALSAACLCMRRHVFLEIDGFDEVNTPIMHSDLDLCFKIRDHGLRLVYMPEAELTHIGHLSIKEIEAKPIMNSSRVDAYLLKRWAHYVAYDPYFPDNMRDMLYIDSPTPYRMYANNPPDSVNLRPNVLIQTHDLSLSGVPIIARDQALHLKAQGAFVTMFAAQSGELLEPCKAQQIPVIVDPLILSSPQAIGKLLANFDVILAHTVLAWRLVLAAKALQIPVLWIIHESKYGVNQARSNPEIQKALSVADRVIFPSQKTLDSYREFGDGRNFVSILLSVNVPEPDLSADMHPSEKIKIVHIGSVEERKGQDVLIQALRLLRPELRDQFDISLIGRILDEEFYNRQVQESADLKNVHWLGSLPQAKVWEHLAASDILVCSSRDETGPLVVYEAMGMGKAVFSTPVGAVPEIIQNGVNGMIFAQESPGELCDLLTLLSLDKALVKRLGSEALSTYNRMLTKHHSNEKIADLIQSMI